MAPKSNNPVSRTFILIKPDAIERKLAGEILRRFERKGFRIVATSLRWIDIPFAEQHYAEHKGNSTYFKQMCEAISKGPSLAVILEGQYAIEGTRQLIGSQNPIGGSAVGTIRGDFALEAPFNIVHGSDSAGAAKKEISLWFGSKFYAPSPVVQEKIEIKPMSIMAPNGGGILPGPPKKKAQHKNLWISPAKMDIMAPKYIENILDGWAGGSVSTPPLEFIPDSEGDPDDGPF